jgi:hypothetical protein
MSSSRSSASRPRRSNRRPARGAASAEWSGRGASRAPAALAFGAARALSRAARRSRARPRRWNSASHAAQAPTLRPATTASSKVCETALMGAPRLGRTAATEDKGAAREPRDNTRHGAEGKDGPEQGSHGVVGAGCDGVAGEGARLTFRPRASLAAGGVPRPGDPGAGAQARHADEKQRLGAHGRSPAVWGKRCGATRERRVARGGPDGMPGGGGGGSAMRSLTPSAQPWLRRARSNCLAKPTTTACSAGTTTTSSSAALAMTPWMAVTATTPCSVDRTRRGLP